jgi:hypothetical protein
MAFLVAIIPGPIKYQSSFAHGTPGPGLRAGVQRLPTALMDGPLVEDPRST